MRVETLKNPGTYMNGLQLRTQAAKAISHAEQFMGATDKQALTDFFYDAAIKAGGAAVAGTLAAVVTSTVKVVVPITGTFVDGITFTVVNGVITAGVLS